MLRIRLTRRVVMFCSILALLGFSALYASFNWEGVVDLSSPHKFEAEFTYENGTKKWKTEVSRGAYNPFTGTVTVSAQVTADDPSAIREIWIETCEDTNANTIIEANEWAVRATGSVHSTIDKTFATIASFALDVKYDGYRLRYTLPDGSDAGEQFLAPGLTE